MHKPPSAGVQPARSQHRLGQRLYLYQSRGKVVLPVCRHGSVLSQDHCLEHLRKAGCRPGKPMNEENVLKALCSILTGEASTLPSLSESYSIHSAWSSPSLRRDTLLTTPAANASSNTSRGKKQTAEPITLWRSLSSPSSITLKDTTTQVGLIALLGC